MGEKVQRDKQRIEAVFQILKKQAPLSVKQEKFCNNACIERFLRARGENVKKAARQLRACLSWRESIGTDYLIADEFSAELAEGAAYVAGHDQEARPVLVFRIKQDYQKLHSQKMYIRLLVFTLEVAIASMSIGVDQFVILFDASFFRSASAFITLFMATLKVLSEFYPGRLHRAFVIDPPSHFSFIWKGARPFVDQWRATTLVTSSDYDDPSPDFTFCTASPAFSSNPRACSLRFTPAAAAPNKVGPSSSSRFSFTVSHLDSLKPWTLSRVDPSPAEVGPFPDKSPTTASPAVLSPLNARSYSFASPAARRFQPAPRTPRPSFLQSPAAFFRKDGERLGSRDTFHHYVRFHRRPYEESSYRAMMRPPLGGLVSIVSPHLIKRRVQGEGICTSNFSQSQRFSRS